MVGNYTMSKKQFLHAAGLAILWTIIAGFISCSGETGGTVEKGKTASCANCPMRARYDRNPKTLLGRLWKWHIGWCPGWKSYLASLPEDERKKVMERYKL
jgi:hypothetical protein